MLAGGWERQYLVAKQKAARGSAMPKLAVRGLSLSRGGKPVLDEISFELAAGELLVVIGPSGSGKSSLLRCLNRLSDIDSGAIELDGRSIYELPVTGIAASGGHALPEDRRF